MRSLLAALVLLIALGGCASSGPPPYLSASEMGTRHDAVTIPEGYVVRTAAFGVAYSTSVSGGTDVNGIGHPVSGDSYERPYVHVFAVEEATGQEVLLVYALGARRDPVLIVRLESGPGAQAQR